MIRKHPLFWKEWKSAKWWSLLISAIFIIMFLSINNKLQRIKELISLYDINSINERGIYLESMSIFEENFSDGLAMAALAMVPIVIIISTLLFQSDRKEKIGAFVSSLPFTKKDQFKVKWYVGLKVITVPFAITSLLSVLMRLANWGWIQAQYAVSANGNTIMAHDTLAAVILSLLQIYLFFIAFYSFLMLVQTLVGNNIAASVIGVIVLAVPWFLIETVATTLSRMLNRPHLIRPYHHENWSLFYTLMFSARDYISVEAANESFGVGVFSYDYYWLKIGVLILIIGSSLYGGIGFYGRNENSRNGQLVMFDWAGKLLTVGVTICTALLGNTVLRLLFVSNTNFIYELITLVFSGFMGHMMIGKILSLTGGVKYD